MELTNEKKQGVHTQYLYIFYDMKTKEVKLYLIL